MTPERRLDILTHTRELIAHPHQWGIGTFVGRRTMIDRFLMRQPRICLMTAVSIAATGHHPINSSDLAWTDEVRDISLYLLALIPDPERAQSPYGLGMMTWNDRHTHTEVIGLVDLAILETRYELEAPTEDEQHEGDDRQDDQDRPEHDSDSTPDGSTPCVKVDCPPLTEHYINYVVPPHDCDHEF